MIPSGLAFFPEDERLWIVLQHDKPSNLAMLSFYGDGWLEVVFSGNQGYVRDCFFDV